MECAICFIECKTFKILQCGHYFCAQCVDDLKRASLISEVVVDEINGETSGQQRSKGQASKLKGQASKGQASKGQASSLKNEGSTNGIVQKSSKSETNNTKSVSASLGEFSARDQVESESTGNVEDDSEPGNVVVEEEGGIPCPQCRRLTPMSYEMKNKYVCKLTCRDCDTEKSDDEFRWCHDCDKSTCSRCFVDKHVNNDPATSIISMHRGSKWNVDYPQAVYCAKRLTQELQEVDETILKNQVYARQYLEGLQEYLCLEIEQRIRASLEPKKALISEICKAFVIDPNKLRSSPKLAENGLPNNNANDNKSHNKSYQTILDEIVKLADISLVDKKNNPSGGDSVRLIDHESLKLKCLPYKQMAEILIESTNSSSSSQPPASATTPKFLSTRQLNSSSSSSSSSNSVLKTNNNNVISPKVATNNNVLLVDNSAQHSCKKELPKFDLKLSTVIRTLTKPNDLCYLEKLDIVLITDYDAGLFFIDPKTFECRQVELKLGGSHWCRVTPFPSKLVNKSGSDSCLVAINAFYDKQKEWKLTLIDLKSETFVDSSNKTTIRGKKYFDHPISFPKSSNAKTAFSQSGFYCVTSNSVFHMKKTDDSLDWGAPIYTVTGSSDKDTTPSLGRPCPTVSNVTDRQVHIYVFDRLWKCLDVLLYEEIDRKILAVRRVDVFVDSLENLSPFDGYFLAPACLLQYNQNNEDTRFDREGPFLIANQSNTKLKIWSGFTNVGGTLSQSKEVGLYPIINGDNISSSSSSNQFHSNLHCCGKLDLLHDFKTKYPQKIIRCPSSLWYISQHAEKPNKRQIEICNILA